MYKRQEESLHLLLLTDGLGGMPQPIQTARDQVELLAGFALDNIDGLVLTKLDVYKRQQ